MAQTSQITHTSSHAHLPVHDQTGRADCFNCIIETYQTQAYNLARRMLDDWSLAEDTVQESLISAYRSFGRFRGENLAAWLLRIVANNCRNMLRSRRARPTVPLDQLPLEPDAASHYPSIVDLPSTNPSPEAEAERTELRETIETRLSVLPAEQRLAVLLVDIHGLSYEEAAVSMDCSIGTIKSRISRGAAGCEATFAKPGNYCLPGSVKKNRAMWLLKSKRRHIRPETLNEYLDGRLSGNELSKVESRLQACDTCREELEELRATIAVVRQMLMEQSRRSFVMDAPPPQAVPATQSFHVRAPT